MEAGRSYGARGRGAPGRARGDPARGLRTPGHDPAPESPSPCGGTPAHGGPVTGAGRVEPEYGVPRAGVLRTPGHDPAPGSPSPCGGTPPGGAPGPDGAASRTRPGTRAALGDLPGRAGPARRSPGRYGRATTQERGPAPGRALAPVLRGRSRDAPGPHGPRTGKALHRAGEAVDGSRPAAVGRHFTAGEPGQYRRASAPERVPPPGRPSPQSLAIGARRRAGSGGRNWPATRMNISR